VASIYRCKFIGTKESVYIRKEYNSHRTGLELVWGDRGGGGWKLQMPHSGARWFTPKPYVGTEKKSATAPP